MLRNILSTLLCWALGLSSLLAQVQNTGAMVEIHSGVFMVSTMDIQNTNGGTLKNGGTLVTTQNLSNNTGATLSGNGAYHVGINWANSATFTAGSSSVSFDGAQNSAVASGGSPFYNVSLNKSAGFHVALGDPMSITNNLDFQSGGNHLLLGNFNLLLGTVTGSGSDRYITTGGTGKVSKNVTTAFTFPVGFDKTAYNPLTLTQFGTPDVLSVRCLQNALANGATGAVFTQNTADVGWDVMEQMPDGSNLVMQFQWTLGDELPLFDRASMSASRHDGANWQVAGAGGTGVGTNPYLFSISGITAPGVFVLSNPCLLTDGVPPSISCPGNRTVNADANLCSSVQTYIVTASDNCSYTLTRTNGLASGTAFPLGLNVVNWKVTDVGGNSTICSFSITVVDAQTPTITCPNSSTVAATTGLCAAVVNYSVSGSDNCSGWSLLRTSGLQSGALFPVGVTTVNWKNTDTGGNSTTCSFSVTVTDGQLPGITCPANITANAAVGGCAATVNYTTPTVSDNCSGASAMHVSGGVSGSSFNKGVNTIQWKATDGANNTRTCSFTITVNDTQAPTITCPANITANTGSNNCAATVTFGNATATDNCTPPPTVAQSSGQASGSSFARGLHTIAFRATDGVGLTKACTFRITVVDNVLPTITCPSNIVKNTDNNLCSAVTIYAVTGADNCTSVSVSRVSGLNSGAAFPKGTNTVVWRATDLAGNSTLCTFMVTVIDAQLPGITCPASISTNTTTGQCSKVVNYTTPTYTDNCAGGSISLYSGLASGSVFPTGSTTIIWRAFDNSANSATCFFTITVTDNELPIASCPPSTTVSGSGSPCGYPASQLNTATASDNCAVTSLTSDAPTTLPAGATTITWTAKDVANNQKTCAYTVTVNCGTAGMMNDEIRMMNDAERESASFLTVPSGRALVTHPSSLITHHLSLSPNPASDVVIVTLSNQQISSSSNQQPSGSNQQINNKSNQQPSGSNQQINSTSNQQIIIHDALGRQVWARKLEAGVEQVKIDLASGVFEDGVYQLSWFTESKVITKTLVVARR